MNWVHVTHPDDTYNHHDVVTQNKEVCQYSVNESSEGGLRIRIAT